MLSIEGIEKHGLLCEMKWRCHWLQPQLLVKELGNEADLKVACRTVMAEPKRAPDSSSMPNVMAKLTVSKEYCT